MSYSLDTKCIETRDKWTGRILLLPFASGGGQKRSLYVSNILTSMSQKDIFDTLL